MLINQATAISTSKVLLVPYEKRHVVTYHEWMKDPDIQEATASEALSIEDEYAMQLNWRNDHDKLTFIVCLPVIHPIRQHSIKSGDSDRANQMIGDVNLFLSEADEDEEGCVGELELMIAPTDARRNGHGRATILSFLHYISIHLTEILDEYRKGKNAEKMSLLQLKVKIGSKNEKSLKLFQSIGFIKVGEGSNYFGEFELVLEGFLGHERTKEMLEKWQIGEYRELRYEES